MVYKTADIKHLDLMAALSESLPIEADEVIVQQEIKASLDENILKLCSGLRAKGFGKQAETLEQKFITYKAAANTHLYRAHDEDGEDLVHAAHPDGDVNMGDGELGDVETTVSKHKKIVDLIQKTPTGKLASYIAQCKIALGQDAAVSGDVPGGAPSVQAPAGTAQQGAQVTQANLDSAKKKAKDVLNQAINDINAILNTSSPAVLNLSGGSNLIGYAKNPSLKSGLERYRDTSIPNVINRLEDKTDISTLDLAKRVVEEILSTIKDVQDNNPRQHTAKAELDRFIPYFYYVMNGIYAAMAYVRGDQKGIEWHSNHLMSSSFATTFRNASAKLQTMLANKSANASPQLLNVYNEIQKYKEGYDALASTLSSLNKTMHVSEIMELPAWQESPFANEQISSIKGLTNLVNGDVQEMEKVLTKYRS